MIMELAKYKEIMSWNENTYRFVPNPQLIRATNSAKNSTNAVKVDNGAIKSSNNLKGVESFICQKYIIKIIKDCVRGLAYLHQVAGIIHRDIKPQNILLCSGKHLTAEE